MSNKLFNSEYFKVSPLSSSSASIFFSNSVFNVSIRCWLWSFALFYQLRLHYVRMKDRTQYESKTNTMKLRRFSWFSRSKMMSWAFKSVSILCLNEEAMWSLSTFNAFWNCVNAFQNLMKRIQQENKTISNLWQRFISRLLVMLIEFSCINIRFVAIKCFSHWICVQMHWSIVGANHVIQRHLDIIQILLKFCAEIGGNSICIGSFRIELEINWKYF